MKTTTSTINNSINHSLVRRGFIIMPFVLMCIATLPGARAVSPAPDGGYPNGNTAEGQNALLHLTTGTFNTAIGLNSLESLFMNTTGTTNTANGAFALSSNTQGGRNNAVGASALASNVTGFFNNAVGTFFAVS